MALRKRKTTTAKTSAKKGKNKARNMTGTANHLGVGWHVMNDNHRDAKGCKESVMNN